MFPVVSFRRRRENIGSERRKSSTILRYGTYIFYIIILVLLILFILFIKSLDQLETGFLFMTQIR